MAILPNLEIVTVKERPDMSDRYIIKSGKYGDYIFDTKTHAALSLADAIKILNEWEAEL